MRAVRACVCVSTMLSFKRLSFSLDLACHRDTEINGMRGSDLKVAMTLAEQNASYAALT